MNLNSCGICMLNIKCPVKCPWHCCPCCLNSLWLFGRRTSDCSCSLDYLLFRLHCFPVFACFSLVWLKICIVCSGDTCRWFKYILKFRNALPNIEDQSSFASVSDDILISKKYPQSVGGFPTKNKQIIAK